jgi:hypothetical protein
MYDQDLFAVDTTGVEELGSYEVFPAGLYPAVMVSASKKPTRNNDGYFIECVYSIIEGQHTGKRFTSRMNLWNSNPTAVGIAKRELKSLRKALGLHDTESNLQQFVNKPMVLNISAKARKDDPSKAENNLIGIEAYGQQAHPAPTAPQQFNGMPQQAPQPTFQQPAPQQPWGAVGAPVAQPAPQMPPQQPAWQPQPGQTPPWASGAR